MKHRLTLYGQCDYVRAEPSSPRPDRCPECPTLPCDECGGEDDRFCPCWADLKGMALADLKGLFAKGGLSVGPLWRDGADRWQCVRCSCPTYGDEFKMSGLCQHCLWGSGGTNRLQITRTIDGSDQADSCP